MSYARAKKKKTRLNTGRVAAAILVLLAVAGFAIGFVAGKLTSKVGSASDLKFDSVSDSSVNLSWAAAKKAEGYVIYQKSGESYLESGRVNGADTCSFKAEGLEQGREYTFAVKGFAADKNGMNESSRYCEGTVCTLPAGVSFESAGSREKGKIHLTWGTNSKSAGYRIEYSEAENFAGAKNVELVSGINEYTIADLNGGTGYYLRICSFIKNGNEQVMSCWSPVREVTAAVKDAPFVDPSKPMIALTFDDGPGYNSASDRILDALQKNGARATFFMLGANSLDHPENLKRKVELGCEIGNHTYDHSHLGGKVTANDISKASEAIYKTCGVYPTAFRSPGGNTTEVIRTECEKEGMPLYYWSLDTNDWKYRDSDRLYNYVLQNVSDGDIVLMHDIYETTAAGVERFIPELISRGFQLVTVSELIEAKTGAAPVPGQQYITADNIKNETR